MGPKVRLTRVHGKGRRARPRWRNGGKTIGLTHIEVGHGARRYSAAGDSGAAAWLMTGLLACSSARGMWQALRWQAHGSFTRRRSVYQPAPTLRGKALLNKPPPGRVVTGPRLPSRMEPRFFNR